MPNETSPLKGDEESRPVGKSHSITLNIEGFRFLAFASFCLMMVIAKFVSDIWVFAPEKAGTKIFGFVEPRGTVDPTSTTIYSIFGFNHACNLIDFNPAKEFAAIVIFMFILPFQLFLILGYYRNKLAYENNEITKLTHDFTRAITIPCICVAGILHLWFVNSPQVSFPPHYIPYMLFQIAIELIHVSQLWYYLDLNQLPFGIPAWFAKFYVRFFILICTVLQIMVFALLDGKPILDPASNATHQKIFKFISDLVSFMTLVMPTVTSGWQYFKSADTNTIVFYHQ